MFTIHPDDLAMRQRKGPWCLRVKLPPMYTTYKQGLREGDSGGTSYPGPGLGRPGLMRPGRVKVVAFSFGPKFFTSLTIMRP